MLSVILSFAASIVGRRDEHSLIRAIADGDHEALRALYDRLSARALAVAIRVLGSRTDAEEVVQDVFVEVWHHAKTYDTRLGSPPTWILSIARNRSIDRLRSRGARARTVERVRQEPLTQASSTPHEGAVERETRAAVQRALSTLSAEQRQLLELAYFNGLSQSEIADHLKEPLGTVKSRVRAALARLQGALDEAGALS